MKLAKKVFKGFRSSSSSSPASPGASKNDLSNSNDMTWHTSSLEPSVQDPSSASSDEGGELPSQLPPGWQPESKAGEGRGRPRRIPSIGEGERPSLPPQRNATSALSLLVSASSGAARHQEQVALAPPPALQRQPDLFADRPAKDKAVGETYDDFVEFLSAKPASATQADAPARCPFTQHADNTIRLSRNADLSQPTGTCPYKHGSVYAGPYPGYLHGNPNRAICPAGCRPKLNDAVTSNESPKDTLLREALEYCELYYHERHESMRGKSGFVSKEIRMQQIRNLIEQTGTYHHTFDELEHGARVAWRNAPKCANRKYWGQLKLLDCRDVDTNQGMYDACIGHLAKAMTCGSSEAYITVFKPAPPGGTKDGPRIWNDQLLQYAAYGNGDEVTGDPKNLRFTEMLKERFGWDGPPDGKRGSYDYLPLVIQADPDGLPELFDVPLECAPPVHIHHPQYPALSALCMQWYPIPAVCALDMTVGGITYTAVPFNGWYANTEVLRDLTDKSRYNMLVPAAKALGIDTEGEAPLWIDDVMSILSRAVYHSFKASKISMIDHHTLINMFWDWYNDEMKHRKYCPVNWKWVIPPMSSSTSPAYLGLNKAQEYTLKPAYIIGKGFLELETAHFGPRDTTKAVNDFIKTVYLAILFQRVISRTRGRKEPVLIICASVTGNAAKWASDLGAILRSSCNVSFFDACGVNAARDADILDLIKGSKLTIFVSSTQGNGDLPSLSEKFFSFLFEENSHLLAGKLCAVLGFGSSAYPIFCGAANHLSQMLAKSEAKEVIPHGKCDAVKGEASAFYEWTENLVEVLASMPSASPYMLRLAEKMKESGETSALVKRRNLMDSVTVEVFTAQEVGSAAARAFMARRGRRRSSVSSTDGSVNEETPRDELLRTVVASTSKGRDTVLEKNMFVGNVKSREDLISSSGTDSESAAVSRKTSLVKIDLETCGNPPYQPGDHIQVIPRNVVSNEELEIFVGHLSGSLNLDDHFYATLENQDISSAELAVSHPLLDATVGHIIPLSYLLEQQVALLAPISMQACDELSNLATSGKDKAVLKELGHDKTEYEKMNSLTGMKWINLFKIFPSLSQLVSVNFLLCNMSMNHPRSYSISSCKAIVGSELHITVGKLIFSRGGSTKEAGICSDYLTSVEEDDEIVFQLESAPSFHHPLDPACPVVFICTGTGFAPIRGLLQKRSYFRSRGENVGPAFLVFGSRCSAEALFDDEIKDFLATGVLTKTFMSYSREPGRIKEYTSDKLQSEQVSRVLSPILQAPNAHVFICGSADMAEQSKGVLKEISSESCIETMIHGGRLHCDVFGALSNNNSRSSYSRKASYTLGDLMDDDLNLDSDSDRNESLSTGLHQLRRSLLKDAGRSQSCMMLQADAAKTRESFIRGNPFQE